MSTRKDQLLRIMAGKPGRAVALTREEKALRDVAEAMNKAHEPADLCQNNPAAPDYVKNRTHWREVVESEVEYVPEQTLEMTLNSAGLGYASITYVGQGELDNYIEEGKRYKVLFDGVSYDVVGSNYGIGNKHITNASDPDTGEPFRIMINRSQHRVFCKVAGTHTLSVVRVDEEIIYHKIPDEYLPDTVELTVATADGAVKTFRLYGSEIVDET